jgi:NitT/TauT family transport system permease protein
MLRIFNLGQRFNKIFTWGDLVVLLGLVVLIYAGLQAAFYAPAVIQGPEISLQPTALPWYAMRSLGRMGAAYLLSMLFTIFYGRAAAYNRNAERVLMPLLDVLQSVPILSFLPVVLLSLAAILPEPIAVELASVVLIFTSQVWNLTFAWYQSLTTIPKELREASDIFRLNNWFRFRRMEFPFATISLVWNSMMSWAGGWFFLMAAEIFTVGERDFRLAGLGAYLQEAANQGNFQAIAWGIGTLVLLIVALDQFIWRPLLAWSERFKLEMVESENPASSWFYDAVRNSRLVGWFSARISNPIMEALDHRAQQTPPVIEGEQPGLWQRAANYALFGLLGAVLAIGVFRAGQFLLSVAPAEWSEIGIGLLATTARVGAAMLIALLWTIPVGVAIGTNPRLAAFLQPLVQIAASVPATALFPVFLLILLQVPGGLNLAAILLMLAGTQWYLLFNIIAGASAIPQDLKYTATLLQLRGWERWRRLVLPALFPFIITGAITASGGAWNASIVAEYAVFQGQRISTIGIGASIARATAEGNYPLLLAATLAMIIAVVLINRLVWRRLYQLAEEKYRME